MMIDYDDVKTQLIDLVTILDMALIDAEADNLYATLNVTNRAIQQLISKLEERERNAR